MSLLLGFVVLISVLTDFCLRVLRVVVVFCGEVDARSFADRGPDSAK